ncbi:MAG TPA: peptidoglycan DD-metalloendopeptidase family protein, partial [Caldilineaceae bacterium]|nr:peptidoglycan DD-metalloendopeptidase family protein [Caldilineaceae bacterium]
MLRNLPFVGNYPVMMSFGDRPDLYGRVSHAGIPLRGHPGIDFALPEGTPVVAVQHGVVLDVRNDPQGYGLSVLLGHRWGQTFYGHLHEVRVQQGQQVGASQMVGLSGQTGLAETPHLHFGLRLLPYSMGDGWCGFSDPMPYLARLTEPKGAIIGPHIIGGIRPHLELLARWQPRLITVLDPNPDEIAALHEVCPNSTIIGRQFVPAQELEERIRTDPVTAASWAHEAVRNRLSPYIHYWQIANEVLQDTDSLPLLNKFELARMRLAERAGYRCALFGFSVGNPDLPESDRLGAWRRLFPALERAEKKGHVVAIHQYGMPDLWGPNNAYDWYLLRLEHQILRRLPFKQLKFAVTEFGIDGLIRGDQPAGWQTFTTPEGYVEQLLKCGRYLERFSGQVLGYTVFTLGHNAPWGTYDIAGKVATYLADLSEKGTWLEVDTQVFDISPRESDTDTDPGPEVTEWRMAQEQAAEPPAPDEPAAAEVAGEEAAPSAPETEQAPAAEIAAVEEPGDQATPPEPVQQPDEEEPAGFEPEEEPALEGERPAEEPTGPFVAEPSGEPEAAPGEPAEAAAFEPEKGEEEPPAPVEPGMAPALEVEAETSGAPEAGPPSEPEPASVEPAGEKET